MRLQDLAFVALVAFGWGWSLAAVALQILAASDSRSLLWLACSRFFLALACIAFAVAFARHAWRHRHALLAHRWLDLVAACVMLFSFVCLGNGHVVPAWLAAAGAAGAAFVAPNVRLGGST